MKVFYIMTHYSAFDVTLGMDIGQARTVLEQHGFFTRPIENTFFSNSLKAIKNDVTIVIMGGMLNKVAALAMSVSHQPGFEQHSYSFLENVCHLTQIRDMVSSDGLYTADDNSLVVIDKHYKYDVKEAILNIHNELKLFLSDKTHPTTYRWINVIMSKEAMGFYDFDYEPIKNQIDKLPDSKVKELYRIMVISQYFKTGLAEI